MNDSERCRAEIAAREKALRSGDPFEMEGLLQGLQDWASELREIDRMMRCAYYNENDPKAAAWPMEHKWGDFTCPHCKRELKKAAPRQKVCSAWKCRMAEIKARNERRRI